MRGGLIKVGLGLIKQLGNSIRVIFSRFCRTFDWFDCKFIWSRGILMIFKSKFLCSGNF